MKNKKRALLVILAATLLLASTVLGTMAWLYDTDSNNADQVFDAGELGVTIAYKNYFATQEKFAEGGIEHDLLDNELVPGKTFDFAPTVTIAPKSEEAYVRVLVTLTNADDLIRLMGSDIDTNAGKDILLPHLHTAGWDASKWTHENINASNIAKFYNAEKNTLTYEFRYFETVKTEETGITLDPVFQSFTLPTNLNNKDIADLAAGLSINFEVQAIQAKNIGNVDQAWAAFAQQVATNANPTGW